MFTITHIYTNICYINVYIYIPHIYTQKYLGIHERYIYINIQDIKMRSSVGF